MWDLVPEGPHVEEDREPSVADRDQGNRVVVRPGRVGLPLEVDRKHLVRPITQSRHLGPQALLGEGSVNDMYPPGHPSPAGFVLQR